MSRSNSPFIFRFIAAVLYLLASAGAVLAAPVVLIDQSHDQRFVIEKDGPLYLSSFAAILKEEGLLVKSSTEHLSDEILSGVDAVVISGPFRSIDSAEIEVLLRFIKQGGRLSVMLHIGLPFSDLLHRLQVDFSNGVLNEQENIIDKNTKNFMVKALGTHPLFAGLNYFSLYGGWALMNTASSAGIIASTSPKAWVDLNGDGKLSDGDAMDSFGVVVAGEYGAGRFVVFGDDAIFQNKFLDENNRQLAKNLARWIK